MGNWEQAAQFNENGGSAASSSPSSHQKRIKKMYLILVLSTVCVFVFQYHISKAQQFVDQVVIKDDFAASKAAAAAHNKPPSSPTNVPQIRARDSMNSAYENPQPKDTSSSSGSSFRLPAAPPSLKPIYIITPTFRRPEQLAEITRLGNTLRNVQNVHWLVVEDANVTTVAVTKLLQIIGVPFEHMIAPMPEKYRRNKVKPRGVSNRNRGLQWIRANATEGVFFFADDDNAYDLRLFDQIRHTRKVSMWPVGLVTSYGLSSPIVKNGTFAGFYDGWIGGRKFPVDMAGFAVSVAFLNSRPKATMPFSPGYEEDGFLKSLAPFEAKEIEFLGSLCTQILAWHTQTKKNRPAAELDLKKYNGTNLVTLRGSIV